MPMRAEQRAAFTVIELALVMVLLAIVGAAIIGTVTRQGRVTRAATELAELRDQLNEGATILASNLRAISLVAGDAYTGTSATSSLEFRSSFGHSIICEIHGPGNISIPANAAGSTAVRLSYLYKRADPGHGLFVFDEGATAGTDDDSWLFRIITSVAGDTAPCDASPFAGAAAGAPPGLALTLNAGLPPTVIAGAPLRFVERVRYALYQSSDGKWYLGYCASNNMSSSCATLQPVSGPYLPPNSDQSSGQSGLDFYYYDEDGVLTTDPFRVARIDIALRGATYGKASLAGNIAAVPIRDTLRTSVVVRNR